jgi:hypothetical protein
MLTLPNAYSKVGLLAAIPLSVGCACMSFWTMYCLIGEQVVIVQTVIKGLLMGNYLNLSVEAVTALLSAAGADLTAECHAQHARLKLALECQVVLSINTFSRHIGSGAAKYARTAVGSGRFSS